MSQTNASREPLPDILFDLDSEEVEKNEPSQIKETIKQRNSIDKQNKELATSTQLYKNMARNRQKELKNLKNTSEDYQAQIRNLAEEFEQYKGNFEVYATIIKETIEEISQERDPETQKVFQNCANCIDSTLERISHSRNSMATRKSLRQRQLEDEIRELEAKKETFKGLLIEFFQVQYGMEIEPSALTQGVAEVCEKSPRNKHFQVPKTRDAPDSYGEIILKLTEFLKRNTKKSTEIDIVTLLETVDTDEYASFDKEAREKFKEMFRKLYRAGQTPKKFERFEVRKKSKGFLGIFFCC